MNARSRVVATLEDVRSETRADPRCPFLAYHNILGAAYVAGLLDHVMAHQSDFQTGVMRNRETGEEIADPVQRDAVYLSDFGAFLAPIKSFVSASAASALSALRLNEARVKPREFVITAYRDGGHIAEHIDTHKRPDRIRILSCVYYFAAMPRRFSGGQLRLYGLPRGPAAQQGPSASFIDIEPRTDTLVIFPSWLRHKVMPVRVPSGAWADSRFTINCWMHRAG